MTNTVKDLHFKRKLIYLYGCAAPNTSEPILTEGDIENVAGGAGSCVGQYGCCVGQYGWLSLPL